MLRFSGLTLAVAFAALTVAAQSPTLHPVPDGPVDNLYYGNILVKPVRVRPGTNTPITIDDTDFFVSQQYVDFLNRFPDQGGFIYWVGTFSPCGTDAYCNYVRRVDVSAAFFVEQEFQLTGSYVYRLYAGTLGRQPQFSEFMPDRSQIDPTAANIAASKLAFANAWVQRPEFVQKYPVTDSNDVFVSKVLQTMQACVKAPDASCAAPGTDLTSQQGTYVSQLNGGATRGQVVENIVENSTFVSTQYNPSFVLMQYFGYLRRDPDLPGYYFWMGKITNNYHEMVCAFVTSAEYQLRFGSTVTKNDKLCATVQ